MWLSRKLEPFLSYHPETSCPSLRSKAIWIGRGTWWGPLGCSSWPPHHLCLHPHHHLLNIMSLSLIWKNAVIECIPNWPCAYFCQLSQASFAHLGFSFVNGCPWRCWVWNLFLNMSDCPFCSVKHTYFVMAIAPLALSNADITKSWAPVCCSMSLRKDFTSSANDFSAFLRGLVI